MLRILLIAGVGVMLFSCTRITSEPYRSPVQGKVICLDPGHGGTAEIDDFRVGPSGEREEWVNLRVGMMLKEMLEDRGADVIMTRTEDVQVGLKERAMLAVNNEADVFLSLHHNATADPEVNFPVIYFHGNLSENLAGERLAECVGKRIRQALFSKEHDLCICSDSVIFPGWGTAVLRHSYGIPGVIGEASFFSNPDEEQRLKQEKYNEKEAMAYVIALEDFFSKPVPEIKEKNSLVQIEPFEVFQEEERAKKEALRWRDLYEQGKHLYLAGKKNFMNKALENLSKSVKYFPDSPVARQCHIYRSKIYHTLGEYEKSNEAKLRAEEHYLPVD